MLKTPTPAINGPLALDTSILMTSMSSQDRNSAQIILQANSLVPCILCGDRLPGKQELTPSLICLYRIVACLELARNWYDTMELSVSDNLRPVHEDHTPDLPRLSL
jgi:hypothetical protein